MFYILYGQDDFSLRQKVQEIKQGLGDPEILSLNTTLLEGQDLTPNLLMKATDSAPFLALNRLVIVEGLLTRYEPPRNKPQRREMPKEELQPWADCIGRIPATTVLVLIDGEIKPANPLKKVLSPMAKVVMTFPLQRGEKLQSWVSQQVAKEGGRISSEAVKALAEMVGSDLWAMSGEIEKLLLYASGRQIEVEDVNKLVSFVPEANIFSLVDALLRRQVRAAHRWLHLLLQQGSQPPYILTMIAREIRFLLLAKALSAEKVPPKEIQERLGITKEFALRRTLELARAYPWARLEEMYRQLLDVDISIKTGKSQPLMALELLVVELGESKKPQCPAR